MTRYEMIMRAAENIDKNPALYNFKVSAVPRSGSDPACMLGEMLRVAGISYLGSVGTATPMLLGIQEGTFLETIDEILGSSQAKFVPQFAAEGMRRFAKKYEGIPDDVRAIFSPEKLAELT